MDDIRCILLLFILDLHFFYFLFIAFSEEVSSRLFELFCGRTECCTLQLSLALISQISYSIHQSQVLSFSEKPKSYFYVYCVKHSLNKDTMLISDNAIESFCGTKFKPL